MATCILLGPQRPEPNLAPAFSSLPAGPVALVSAGWQEGEGDTEEIAQLLERSVVDLQLYERTEELFAGNPALHEVYRERQDRLQELQRLYQLRLRQSMLAARRLLRAEGDPEILRQEQRHAISQQRVLDRHHLRRIVKIHRQFAERAQIVAAVGLEDHCRAIGEKLSGSAALLIAGGNVAVLLNRLRLFNVADMLGDLPIVAWSAGAMVLTETVVLFHDNTPQGRRDAEVFDQGLGLVRNLIVLPAASQRLMLGDKVRTGLFSRRFAPDRCFTLDNGAALHLEDQRISKADQVRRLARSGAVRKVNAQ